MRGNLPSRLPFSWTVIFVAILAIAPLVPLEAKDLPEAPLLGEGRLFEALLLLEGKPKDFAAQERAAELCIKLALYERAAERLVAAGRTKDSALATVIDAALADAQAPIALRMAEAAGPEALRATRGKVARLEFGEGRFVAALDSALLAGETELATQIREAMFRDLLDAKSGVIPFESSRPDRVAYVPGGRNIILWDLKELSQLEILPAKPGGKGRFPWADHPLSDFSFSDDGRFLSLTSLSKDKKGATVAEFRIERIDTGLEIYSATYNASLAEAKPVLAATRGGKLSLNVRSPQSFLDYLVGKPESLGLARPRMPMDHAWAVPQSGLAWKRFASARGMGEISIPDSALGSFALAGGGKYELSPMSQPLPGGNAILYSDARDAVLSPDGETLAILAFGEGAIGEPERKKAFQGLVMAPEARFARGVFLLPYPFLDRLQRAATLAAAWGKGEDLIPAAESLLASRKYDQALELLSLAGVDTAKRHGVVGEAKLRDKGIEEAAVDLAKAGQADRIVALAEARLAKVADRDLSYSVTPAENLYAKAGRDPGPMYHGVARRLEAAKDFGSAAEFYGKAKEPAEIIRLLDPKSGLYDKYLPDLEKLMTWVRYIGEKAGLDEVAIRSRTAAALEERKDWNALAYFHADAGNAGEFRRFALLCLESGKPDSGIIGLVLEKGDNATRKEVASRLVKLDMLDNAAALYEAADDKAGLVSIADKAYEAGDYLMAAGLYAKASSTSSQAKSAERIALVLGELDDCLRVARLTFPASVVERLNSGALPLLWPIPDAKLADPGYVRLKSLGEEILALPSRPSSSEAQKCATATDAVAARRLKEGYFAQAASDSNRAQWFSFAARFMKAMGR